MVEILPPRNYRFFMRIIVVAIILLGTLGSVRADEVVTGRVIKVLPLLLDKEGNDAPSPSLFDRDAYQVQLREHTNQVSGFRMDVQWKAVKADNEKLKLRVELRGVGPGGLPRVKQLEASVTPQRFSRWTDFTVRGDDYRQFGTLAAWRATLWNGDQLLGEQKSFLW